MFAAITAGRSTSNAEQTRSCPGESARNELSTIEVCRAICDAQHEYAAVDHDGQGAGAYAAKIVSTPSKRDGLYWPETDPKTRSPLGQWVAEASAKGYGAGTVSAAKREPYHGYDYRLLDQQGDAAPGGAMKYVQDGRMTGGFAVIAEPAAYGSSGVMTFLVSARGIVYQCDLGEDTAKVAAAVKSFDPDEKWTIVRDGSARAEVFRASARCGNRKRATA